jgi:HPt (histidine-containing phosphotransfer) domain-containing protein
MKYLLKIEKEIFTIYVFSETGNLFGDHIARLFQLKMNVLLKHFGSKIEKKKNYAGNLNCASFHQIAEICKEIKKGIEENSLDKAITTPIERINLIEELINRNEIIHSLGEVEKLQNNLNYYLEQIKPFWEFVKDELESSENIRNHMIKRYRDDFFS